ncbi:hypothetical protein [Desulfovirgula thermocuniculi]|uniref:hypothetical protein n=1 Tax=Desulfovirgula thermocuniculi TaxID=348842 RepID=UPI0003F5E7B3|nr:hypothetical protein [Desulfovirgula thermocuniculi]
MAETKQFLVRLTEEQATAVDLVAKYRGETRAEALLAAFRLLAKETFAEEIESGADFPLQKLPVEVRLSDVLRVLGVR